MDHSGRRGRQLEQMHVPDAINGSPQTAGRAAARDAQHRGAVDVSVIIPTYNRLWCLPEAIASCREMRCSNEIIVVDDGSTDGTWDWLQQQSGLRILRQPNLGKAYAVNRAFEAAVGEYVRFLDSDDLLPAGATDLQLAKAREAAADVVVAGYTAWRSDRGEETRGWTACDDFLAQQLGECDSSHYSAYLFRKQLLEGVRHKPEYAFRDDRMFVIEMALRHPRLAVFERPGLIHRHHGQDRLQFRPGMAAVVSYWQEKEVYVRAAALLAEVGEATPRRRRAIAASLWPVARRIGFSDVPAALRLVAWMRDLSPDFSIPMRDSADRLYAALGFPLAQRLVNVARVLRNLSGRMLSLGLGDRR